MSIRLNAERESNTRRHGRWLVIARVVWIALAVVALALFGASIPLVFNELRTVGTGVWQLSPREARALEQLGLSVGSYAAYWMVMQIVFVMGFAIVAGVIFRRKSDDWMALFVSLFLLISGTMMVTAVPVPTTMLQDVWYFSFKIVEDLSFIFFLPFFFVFPDGQFVPRWTRLLVMGWIAFGLFKRLLPLPPLPGDPIFLGLLAIGALAQIYRYRRVSTAAQRQQTKWVVFGFVLTFVVSSGVQLPFMIFPWLRQSGAALLRLPALTITLLSSLILPVTIGISILRYRLWDIDIIIRRTLVYSALTGLLALVYFGSVVVLQSIFRAATGQSDNQFITVASTLAIAALFAPLRRRVQDVIDRRFYRKKYDAAKTLAAFAATCRDETDLDKLAASLIAVVQETMQPESVSLWLKPTETRPGRLRSSGPARSEGGDQSGGGK
ncbi:MAG: hypothetical protein HW378_4658 [Anaerolineales bacterium]|nr:hypothetical protein [Anaerolineales bacterium]